MSELENSISLKKPAWQGLRIRQFAHFGILRGVRSIVYMVLLAGLCVLAVESLSSYVLYRHFAGLNHNFYPAGSATVDLMENVIAKLRGRHTDDPIVTIDHGPLFRSDATLGYGMYPGRYRIMERRESQSHLFNLTVDDAGRRISSATPSTSSKHIYIAGDSGMFGWGLNDEETLPWLIQSRFRQYDVVNLSLTSYSTVQSLLVLQHTLPKVEAGDIVVLTYHPITNAFNVASGEMLGFLRSGFEHQLGDAALVNHMIIPFGSIDNQGNLIVEHYAVGCGEPGVDAAPCPTRQLGAEQANRVTERAFDAIFAATPGHIVVALLGGADSDPVIEHLRSKGVLIADLRLAKIDPDATDMVEIDGHAGPFWHHDLAVRLGDALQHAHWVD
jgi:hypothetical protein